MNQYEIRYTRSDMPDDYISVTTKWANDPKSALKYMLKKSPEKDGTCFFKRGGSGKIISTKEIK
jgi:hypothetical protein